VESPDVSQYCRDVEDHLTRVNGGHLVRIVGAGFELVRRWAEDGVPLSVVFRGIELKADRHQIGQSRRPLRIEFCESDVRQVYDGWRRAVGLTRRSEESQAPEAPRKRPSLAKHVERAIDRLGRVAGRLDLPEPFLDAIALVLQELVMLRDTAKRTRGLAREEAAAQLAAADARMMAAARQASPEDVLVMLDAQAGRELSTFRDRLAGDAWRQALDATVDRLLRDRYGLPVLID
jgi:hypothetical protein